MKTFATILIIIVAIAAIGYQRISRGESAPLVASNPSQNPYIFCPPLSQLQKNPVKGNWIAHTRAGFWKSYHLSFATNVTKFIGAQWVGENVGQIACYYNSVQKLRIEGKATEQATIPVTLVFHTLTLQPPVPKPNVPSNIKWAQVEQSKYNCSTFDRLDCPFKVNIRPHTGNIFQEAEAAKYQKTKALPPPPEF